MALKLSNKKYLRAYKPLLILSSQKDRINWKPIYATKR